TRRPTATTLPTPEARVLSQIAMEFLSSVVGTSGLRLQAGGTGFGREGPASSRAAARVEVQLPSPRVGGVARRPNHL
ncbi:MAG: hypothetical protein V3R16_07600, partial [Nitrospirales bacterium]